VLDIAADGHIQAVRSIVNPDKLRHLDQATFRRSGRLTSGAAHDANEQRGVTYETRCADLGIAKERAVT